MAFKKTSEGRVYFQGTGNGSTANDETRETRSKASRTPLPQPDSGPTQLQILALLRSLNDKLKATQVERNTMRTELENYRRSMETLNTKAQKGERAEKIAQETLKELSETRKIMLELEERQAGIEKESKSASEKIRIGVGSYRDLVKRLETTEQKQEEVARKVEEATAQQAKIMRQIEKAIEDRTRFMRKIERIEETVIQTRDALNAKAMVLLTDQNISGAVSADIEDIVKPEQEPGVPTAIRDEEMLVQPWTASRSLQAAAIALLVVGGILAGWAVSEMQRPQYTDSGEFQIGDTAPSEQSSVEIPDAEGKADAIVNKWNVSEDTSAFSEDTPAETAPATPTVAKDPANDIGAVDLNDQDQIQKMLEEDPDKLAAELNKIEPSAVATNTPQGSEEKPEEVKLASIPEKLAPQETSNIDHDEPEDAAPVYTRPDVDFRKLIKPDANLPDSIKTIETQAFDGVPEAQHDLAAIYTAGHAGVKQDFKRAMFWFEQAANAGVANAAYNLGVLYHQGLGTKADIGKAIAWYTKAAELGHPEAQYNLGIAYIEGVGVSYDPFKANSYFEKAAAQGIMEAAYNLGLIYENGLLGKPQPDEALVWYKEAADKGSPEAKSALEQLAKTLNIKMEDINKIVDNVKTAKKGASPDVKTQIRSDAAPNRGQPVILAQIQEHLMDMGLYPGPADGADSQLSQDAIRAYQKLNGLEATGQPSTELLAHMMSEEDKKTGSKYN